MNANTVRPNIIRGEAVVAGYMLRPTFTALVAAENELGSLFALVERAASGQLRLREMAALFWHCCVNQNEDRDTFCEAVAAAGLAAATPALKSLLGQILSGQ